MDSRTWRMLALVLLLAAVGTAVYGVSTGQLSFALFLVFPVFYGSGGLALLVGLLLFGAFAAWGAGAFASAREHADAYGADPRPSWAPREEERWVERGAGGADTEVESGARRRTKWGGVVLLGPIPIAFGNDRRMLVVLMGLALLIVVVVLAFSVLGGRGG